MVSVGTGLGANPIRAGQMGSVGNPPRVGDTTAPFPTTELGGIGAVWAAGARGWSICGSGSWADMLAPSDFPSPKHYPWPTVKVRAREREGGPSADFLLALGRSA